MKKFLVTMSLLLGALFANSNVAFAAKEHTENIGASLYCCFQPTRPCVSTPLFKKPNDAISFGQGLTRKANVRKSSAKAE